MSLTDEQISICNWVGFGFGVLSLLGSVLTLVVIHKMKHFNGYLLLIASASIFQVLYDVNYILGISETAAACIAWQVLDVVGGLSVSVWTNIVSFIVYYVVTYIKSVDIFKNYPLFFCIAVLPPLALGIIEISVDGVIHAESGTGECYFEDGLVAMIVHDAYYWGRIASILLNFAVYFLISWRLRRMNIRAGNYSNDGNSLRSSTSSKGKNFSPQQVNVDQGKAIYVLVRRMKYYPLAQALCRSGAAWNEYADYRYDSFPSYLLASICSPSTGFCYFVIFLIIQPRAYSVLLSMFCCVRGPNGTSAVGSSVNDARTTEIATGSGGSSTPRSIRSSAAAENGSGRGSDIDWPSGRRSASVGGGEIGAGSNGMSFLTWEDHSGWKYYCEDEDVLEEIINSGGVESIEMAAEPDDQEKVSSRFSAGSIARRDNSSSSGNNRNIGGGGGLRATEGEIFTDDMNWQSVHNPVTRASASASEYYSASRRTNSSSVGVGVGVGMTGDVAAAGGGGGVGMGAETAGRGRGRGPRRSRSGKPTGSGKLENVL